MSAPELPPTDSPPSNGTAKKAKRTRAAPRRSPGGPEAQSLPAKGSARPRATPRRKAAPPDPPARPKSILVVDIGGTKLKVLASGQTEPRRLPTGTGFTPQQMVDAVRELAADWRYDAVSIGYPGQVGDHGPRQEPGNLGAGWVGFNYAAALGCPVRIINDAAMQALGSYDGGRMLFLGFGTGLGSALIAENVIVPLELGNIPEPGGRSLGDVLGRRGLRAVGKKRWRRAIARAVPALMAALMADYVVLGGGNAKHIKVQPPGSRLSNNLTAFRGGYRLWHVDDVPTLRDGDDPPPEPPKPVEWRLI